MRACITRLVRSGKNNQLKYFSKNFCFTRLREKVAGQVLTELDMYYNPLRDHQ